MRKAVFTLLASGFLLAACAPQQETIHLSNTFDPSEAEFILTDGTATIDGQSFLRQSGGGVVTCAGSPVTLLPKTKYSDERVQHLYGNMLSGIHYGLFPKFVPNSSDYYRLTRTAQCDAQGNFEFSNVPAGKFYIGARVEWVIAEVQQGGIYYETSRCRPGTETKGASYAVA